MVKKILELIIILPVNKKNENRKTSNREGI